MLHSVFLSWTHSFVGFTRLLVRQLPLPHICVHWFSDTSISCMRACCCHTHPPFAFYVVSVEDTMMQSTQHTFSVLCLPLRIIHPTSPRQMQRETTEHDAEQLHPPTSSNNITQHTIFSFAEDFCDPPPSPLFLLGYVWVTLCPFAYDTWNQARLLRLHFVLASTSLASSQSVPILRVPLVRNSLDPIYLFPLGEHRLRRHKFSISMPTSLEEHKKQLYNRQEYVVGSEAQARYGQTTVLVVGACGLAAEIIKNLVLTGVKAVLVCDDAPIVIADLSTNFFLKETDVGKPRGTTVAAAAKELNRFVEISAVSGDAVQYFPNINVVVYVNYRITTLVDANEAARQHNVKFIACESRGIAGCIFVDAGSTLQVVDADGEDTVSCVVTGISGNGLVIMHDDKKHECEVGSRVYFTGIVSPPELNSDDPSKAPRGTTPVLRLFDVQEVTNPHILKLKNVTPSRGGREIDVGTSTYLHTTKKQKTMHFLPLRDSIEKPEFNIIFDSESKLSAAETLHAVFRAVGQVGATPTTVSQMNHIIAIAKSFHAELDVATAEKVLAVFSGDLNPMACFLGGMAAQEVLKVCSGKFTPILQWHYLDVREILEHRSGTPAAWIATAQRPSVLCSRYAGQIAVLGEAFQAYMHEQRGFIVGAGALGCELIKNASLMGFGAVSITDMDNIEVSNLSRQFLFRTHHIGRPKSTVAAEASKSMNPSLDITSYEDKMGSETEGVFNEDFWSKHSVIMNALDNLASRKYVDSRCLFYKKPLFESGTLGTKCNMQCVIPFVTESYSSSFDPPEKAIPLCTLKNFPNAIEHTIEWARDQFHLLFHSNPEDVNSYLQSPASFAESLQRDPAAAGVALKNVNRALRRWPQTEEECVREARLLFHNAFYESFRQLLYNIPLDKVGEDGQLFWSGAKKPPTPQVFDPTKERDVQFVYHCAFLLAEAYGLHGFTLTLQQVAQVAASTPVPNFAPRHTTYATSETDKKDPALASQLGDVELKDLPPVQDFAGKRMRLLEFEKDDPTNHHVEFITYGSNIRAEAYSIPPADLNHTKRIAGNIIPAMVTTTSLVTGLVGLEVLKYLLVQFEFQAANGAGVPYTPAPSEVPQLLSYHRNAFVNIALPFVAFSDPVMAEGRSYALPSGGERRWGIWDRIDVNEGRDISMSDLIGLLATRYELDVFMIALPSGRILYTQFGGKAKDKTRPVLELAQERGEVLQIGEDYLNLVATGMIGDEEEVDVPSIRYKCRNF